MKRERRIVITDKTSCVDEGLYRGVGLEAHCYGLLLLGNLSRNTVIDFDKRNAKKLITYLQQKHKLKTPLKTVQDCAGCVKTGRPIP